MEHMGYFREHFKNLILTLLGIFFLFFLRCDFVNRFLILRCRVECSIHLWEDKGIASGDGSHYLFA